VASIIFILASFAEIAKERNYLALEKQNSAIIPSLVFSGALERRIVSRGCGAEYKYSRGNDSVTRVYHTGSLAHQGH
jgi:hypothetical protein